MTSFKTVPLSHCKNSSTTYIKVGNNRLGDRPQKLSTEADETHLDLVVPSCESELPANERTTLLRDPSELEEENEDGRSFLVSSSSLEESLIGSSDVLVDEKPNKKSSTESQRRSIDESSSVNKHSDLCNSYPLFPVRHCSSQKEGKTSDYSSLSSYNSRVSEEGSQEGQLDERQWSLDILPEQKDQLPSDKDHEGRQSSASVNFSTTQTGSCLKGSIKSTGSVHVQFESPHESREILPVDTVLSTNGDASSHKISIQSADIPYNEACPFDSLKKCRKKRRHVSGSSTMSIGSTSTSTSDSRTTEFERRAPDGGWGWVVVFASFMVHCIADGITMSFGVLYVEFLSYFKESKSLTSWVGSLFMAIPLLAGPLASLATDHFGCKTVTIWGSILACLGFFVSAFANSLHVLFFTVGLITGLGLAVCYVAAIVIVAFYFEKRRSLATGIAVAGSGIGTFLFAPVIQYFIKDWGWRGGMILLAGIILNMAVCGSLMRDLPWIKKKRNKSRMGSIRRGSTTQSSDTIRFGAEMATPAPLPSLDELRRLVESGEASAILTPDQLIADAPRSSSLIVIPTFLNRKEGIPPDLLSCLSSQVNSYEIASMMYPHLLSRSLSQSLSQIDSLPKESNRQKRRRSYFEHQDSLQNEENPKDKIKIQIRRRSSYQEENVKDLRMMLKKSASKNSSKQNGCQNFFQNGVNGHRENCENSYSKFQHKMSLPSNCAEALRNMRVNRQSMTFRGAMFNINRHRLRASSCPNIYRNSIITIADTQTPTLWSCLRGMGRMMLSCASIEYFANIPYLIFSMSNFILYVFYDTVYMYISDYAQGIGISSDDSADLISAIGIFNCIGMVIMGYLGDQAWSSPLLIYAVSMVICGLSIIFVPFLTNYWTLAVSVSSFGFFISANYALTAVILVELISLEAFSKSYGLLLLIQGIANLIGPPLVGFMADATGEYIYPFVMSGVFIIVCGILLVLIPCSKRKNATRTSSSGSRTPNSASNCQEIKSLTDPIEEVV